ncbi:MAG: HD domain-containing protein [Sphingobacteriales bacterium]|nr:MAG: HD domain-containing protein [Sphingobacteriales bacterium]
MTIKGKIINDPVYGFLRFPEREILQIIGHRWFQRLRHIKQMGFAHLVYPGATHTRFHHSLGACHLMGKAIDELRIKGIEISSDECVAARSAILLHDIGHGPFSHALEHSLVECISHESISHLVMKRMNEEYNGILTKAISVFNHSYPKKYLHQLVSSQLDVDRMDYLNRDSFYTGVSEGVIGYDRILQMLTVRDGELMVEEKGVHSVEKFIIARRLMYWQVYLHKTVLGSEVLLINILTRAKELCKKGDNLFATPALQFFLHNNLNTGDFEADPHNLELFCQLDDNDILTSIKVWQSHSDKVLALLCRMLVQRKLYKVRFSAADMEEELKKEQEIAMESLGIDREDIHYFVSAGTTYNNTYNINDERITIAMKTGISIDISEIDNPIVSQALAQPVHKNYICYIHRENLPNT